MSPGSSGKDLQVYTLPQRTTRITTLHHSLPKTPFSSPTISSRYAGDSRPQPCLKSPLALRSRQPGDAKTQEKTKQQPSVEAGGPENAPAPQGPTKALLSQLLVSYTSLSSQGSGSAEGDSSIPAPQTPPPDGNAAYQKPARWILSHFGSFEVHFWIAAMPGRIGVILERNKKYQAISFLLPCKARLLEGD